MTFTAEVVAGTGHAARNTTTSKARLAQLRGIARGIQRLTPEIAEMIAIAYIHSFPDRSLEALDNNRCRIRLGDFAFTTNDIRSDLLDIILGLSRHLLEAFGPLSSQAFNNFVLQIARPAMEALYTSSLFRVKFTIPLPPQPAPVAMHATTASPAPNLSQTILSSGRPLGSLLQSLHLTITLALRAPFGSPRRYPLPSLALVNLLPNASLKYLHVTVVEELLACDWRPGIANANGIVRLRAELEEVVRNLRQLHTIPERSFTYEREIQGKEGLLLINQARYQNMQNAIDAQAAKKGETISMVGASGRDVVTRAYTNAGAEVVIATQTGP